MSSVASQFHYRLLRMGWWYDLFGRVGFSVLKPDYYYYRNGKSDSNDGTDYYAGDSTGR